MSTGAYQCPVPGPASAQCQGLPVQCPVPGPTIAKCQGLPVPSDRGLPVSSDRGLPVPSAVPGPASAQCQGLPVPSARAYHCLVPGPTRGPVPSATLPLNTPLASNKLSCAPVPLMVLTIDGNSEHVAREGKQVFLKNNIKLVTDVDLNKFLKQIKLSISLLHLRAHFRVTIQFKYLGTSAAFYCRIFPIF